MKNVFKVSTGTALGGLALGFLLASSTAFGASGGGFDPAYVTPHATPTANSTLTAFSDESIPASAKNDMPCETASANQKKDKKDKKDKDKKETAAQAEYKKMLNQAEPGTNPGNCNVNSKKFDPNQVVGVGSDLIKVKPGSLEDVDAVGHRDIFHRGLGNWYSMDAQIRMGKSYAQQIDQSSRFITDPVVDTYINTVGQNIVRNSDCKVPFTIKVIDSDVINAFALPGGFFYVDSGLILAADNEAELAGVMSHETAHVCAQHAAREMTRMHYAQIGMVPLIMMTGYTWTGYGIYEATQLAIPVVFLKFSRDFEAQADYLGVQYMYRAGYDPQGMIDMFEKIEALQKRKPGLVDKIFSNHPMTPERILHTQEEIARILPPRHEYLENTSEFEAVKARLARIINRQRLMQTKGPNKPSLRHASTGSGTNKTDQPTLHRRGDENQNFQ